ncbi:fibropellin-1-like [Montipora capricornis]|uniref:fibropellin-1-like n=1 Tax=Montipora capricornis TaxID=246305 RepID=UPI0035F1445A
MGIFVTNTNKLRMTEVWTHIAVLWFSFVLVTQARCKNLRKRNSSLLDTFNHRSKPTRLYPFWTNNFIRSYIHAGRIVRSGVAEGFTKFTGRIKRETSNNGHKTKLGRKVSTALPQPAKPLRVVATSAVIKNRRRKPPPLKAIHIWGATPFNTVLRNLQMLNAKIQKQGGAVKRLFLPVQIQRTQFLNSLSKQSVPRQMQPFTRPDGFLNVNGPGIIPAPLSGIHFQQGPPPQPPLLHLPDPVRRLPPVMPLPSFRGTGPGQVLEPAAGYDFHSVHDDSPVQGMEAMNDMGPTSISEITPPIENNPTAETRAMSEESATRDLTPTIEYDNDPQFGPKSFETTPNFETPSGVFGPPPPPVSWLAGEIHEEVNRHVKKGVSKARCSPNPCKNDGRCTAFEERYECDCPIGFMGKNCQDVNHCLPNPCKNEGNCYATSYGYHCTCVKGFKGPNCDIFSKCTSNPCKNGGTCEDGRDSYKCSCLPGFKGTKCEATDHCSNGNPCKNGGTCLNGESRFECKCLPGYNGLDCGDVDVCYSNPCQNSGTCHNTGAGQFICQCLITFRGITCEEKIPKCESQPCQNGGTCVENDREEEGFYCKCLEKYQGKHCQELQGPCSKNPCLNEGKCIEIEETFRCVCKDGFNGSTCEVKVLPLVPLCTGCHKYAVCVDGKCACKAGYFGNGNVCEEPTDSNYTMNYAKNTTSPILPTPGRTQLVMNSCHPNPCYNGGTCHKNDVGFDCECPLNYIGTLCKGIRPCLSNPCQNEGTCIDEGLLDDYVCKCKNGYKGKNCEDAGVCEPNPCHNGGTCQQKRSSYVCQCNERFEGSTCAEDKCAKCDVHAHCETGKCVCDAGFYGNGIRGECYRAGASNPRFCVPNPCRHGGSCYEKPNGHSCQCTSGYQGNYCELSIAAPTQRPPASCAGYPCLHDGSCVPKGKKFQCMCLKGFQGATCEQRSKSYCHPNPCLHGGSCTEATDGYSCRCIGSYRGTNCEVDDCDQCDIHAICVQGACRCRVGFKGDGFQCEKLKRCRRCSPNATCINDECVCKPGFIGNGKHCQKDDCKGCPSHSHCVRGICICVPGFYFNGHRCVAAVHVP